MKRHWMPFYFSDYLADTGHLSTVEHGAYLLLIAHYWAHDGLPEDEAIIARITRMTGRQWSQSRDRLRSLFGDNWCHKRIDKEIAKAIEKSKVNSANAQRRHSERTAVAQRSDTQLQLQPQRKKDTCAVKHRTEVEFEKFKAAYPKRKGSQGWPEAKKYFCLALKEHPPEVLIGAAKKHAETIPSDREDSEFVPMAATWMRKKLYLEFIPTPEEIEKARKVEEFLASRGFGVIEGGRVDSG